jgi:GR25 family glycosyltransferase involved in LPS biosynthesis
MKDNIPLEKYYGLCIAEERRKNLEKYEKIFDIEIDTSLSENALEKGLNHYKKTGQIVNDWIRSTGAAGCTISFCKIYKDIVKNKYSHSLIFEDDIDWNDEFYGECTSDSFYGELSKIDFKDDWDIFYIGTENQGAIKKQRHIIDNIYELQHGSITSPIEGKSFEAFNNSRKTNKIKHLNFGGQQAFILTYNGAKQLLKYHDPAYEISDGLVAYAISNGDIKNRSFIPTLFTQLSHPRIPECDNKLWSSMTGTDKWSTRQKYSEDMPTMKKGCSGWPLSEKYDGDFKRKQFRKQ